MKSDENSKFFVSMLLCAAKWKSKENFLFSLVDVCSKVESKGNYRIFISVLLFEQSEKVRKIIGLLMCAAKWEFLVFIINYQCVIMSSKVKKWWKLLVFSACCVQWSEKVRRIFGFRQCIVVSSRYKAFLSLSWDGGAGVSVSLCVWKGKWKERGRKEREGKKERERKGNKRERKLSDYSYSNNIQ